jgi:hypothetical protein
MSAPLIPTPPDIRGEVFPLLTASQIDRVRPLSKVRKVAANRMAKGLRSTGQ